MFKTILFKTILFPLAVVMPAAANRTLLQESLPPSPAGPQMTVIEVEYEPGGATPAHRHSGAAFVYVLEGSVVSQVEGGKETTYTKGQTYFEPPMQPHLVSRNASKTEKAKILVVFVGEKGKPLSERMH